MRMRPDSATRSLVSFFLALLQGCAVQFNRPIAVSPDLLTLSVAIAQISVLEGHGKTLTSSDLSASASGLSSGDIQFTVSAYGGAGAIYKNETALSASESFTQADIESGIISYRNTADFGTSPDTVSLTVTANGATTASASLLATFTRFSDWSQAIDYGATGMNNNGTADAGIASVTALGDTLYASWPEDNGTDYNINASVFGGNFASPSWTAVDNGTLNLDGTELAGSTQLITLNSKLYALTEEQIAGIGNIHLQVYNGNDASPSWTFVDGGTLNINTALQAGAAVARVLNGALYVMWRETTGAAAFKIRVKKYNGNDASPSWTDVSGDGANGLNVNGARTAFFPTMIVHDGKLYAAWPENDASAVKQIYVKVYNGNDASPAWSSVHGATSLNISAARQANRPSLASTNNALYIVWQEMNASAVDQIRVKKYNGNDASPSWTDITAGTATDGLNYDASRAGTFANAIGFGMGAGRLYVTWKEQTATVPQARVAMFDGDDANPSWSFLDGGGASGINKDPSLASFASVFSATDDSLFISWLEDNSGGSQLSYSSMLVRAE